MAATILAEEDRDPIQFVADAASKKIDAAIALLDECRAEMGSPVPATLSAKPKSPAARTKRKGK